MYGPRVGAKPPGNPGIAASDTTVLRALANAISTPTTRVSSHRPQGQGAGRVDPHSRGVEAAGKLGLATPVAHPSCAPRTNEQNLATRRRRESGTLPPRVALGEQHAPETPGFRLAILGSSSKGLLAKIPRLPCQAGCGRTLSISLQ